MQRLSLQLLLCCQLSVVCCISQGRHLSEQQECRVLETVASSMCSTLSPVSVRADTKAPQPAGMVPAAHQQHQLQSTCAPRNMQRYWRQTHGSNRRQVKTDLHRLGPVLSAH